LTTAADTAVAPVHDRMPLLLPPDDFAPWLDQATSPASTRGRNRAAKSAGLVAQEVGPWVNDARHEGPAGAAPGGVLEGKIVLNDNRNVRS
jgi:putative SOS response-associated peptidase YedK